jgi:hypothetical protein
MARSICGRFHCTPFFQQSERVAQCRRGGLAFVIGHPIGVKLEP